MNWKRAAAWVAAVIAAVVVLGVIAAVVLLRSSSFQRYLLDTAEHQATEAIGAPVEAQSFSFHPSNLSLDLYHVRVLGANGHPYPPLLEVDHIGLSVKIISLLRRDWRLQDVVLDHPVAHMLVDRHGGTNLPKAKTSGGRTSVFQLAVQHVRLSRGEIYYNDRKSALDADLHELTFISQFDNTLPRYSGTLSYRDGRLLYDGYNPIPHSLDASFDATPEKFTLPQATLTSGPSRLALTATLENYARPRIQARYQAALDTDEFRRAMKNPSLPSGVIQVSGTLNYQSEPNRPLLASVAMQGDVSSPLLEVRTPAPATMIRDLRARYQIAGGDAEISDLRAQLLGGELNGALTMRNLTGRTESRLKATLHGVSVADLKPLAGPGLRTVGLRGRADGDVEATWGRSMQDLVARADATVQAAVTPPNAPAVNGATPVQAAIHARYVAARKEIALTQTYVRLPQTSILLDGAISTRSSLQVRAQARDLHELEAIVDAFQKSPQPLGLYGQATFAGAVRGTTTDPQITGQLTADNLRMRGTAWRLLRANLSLSPSQASLQDGVLEPAQQGRITLNARAGLRRWSFTPGNPFAATASVSQLQLAQVAQLTNTKYPASGLVSANVSVHGSELEPEGNGAISLTKGKVGGETIQALQVRFQGTGAAVHATATLHIPAGVAQANLTYFPKEQGYEGTLQAANLRLDQLQAPRLREMQIAGLLTIQASGRGTLRNPEAQLSIQAPQLQVEGHTIDSLKLNGDLRDRVATVALDSEVENAYVRGRGTVEVGGDYNIRAALDTSNIPLQPILAAYLPEQAPDMQGNTEIHATLQGPLKKPALLNAHVDVPVFALSYKDLQIAAATPILASYTNGVLQVQHADFRGTGTDLQVQGTVPLRGTAPASLTVTGNLDLRLVQILQPDIQSGGAVQFDIRTAGTLTSPDVQGQIRIVNASFQTLTLPVGVQNANGVLAVRNDRLDVTQLQADVGGGKVQMSGGVVYRPNLQFDLALAAKGVRLLYPEGVRTQFDTNLGLTGTTEAALLRGAVRIDRISFTPDFDLSTAMGQFTGEVAPPPTQGFTQNVRLNVTVQSTTGLNVVSRTLSLRGGADLRVGGTAADPVITGRADLTSGDIIFLGNRYVIQGGTINFINPVRTEPVVNLRATTTIEQYNINLNFEGPVERMRTTYTSNPALPPVDIIHLIAFGKTTEAPQTTTPGTLGAESVLASGLSGAVTSRIAKIAGISQLSIDPNLAGTGAGRNPGPTIALQQRVTSQLYVTFSTDLTSTQKQQVQIQYQVSPRWAVSATRDQNGGFGFNARFHKTF